MIEKGYRLVQCPDCPAKLKLSISEKQYGRTLEVTCPACGTKCRVTIPKPADVAQKETDHGKPTSKIADDFGFGNTFADTIFGTKKK